MKPFVLCLVVLCFALPCVLSLECFVCNSETDVYCMLFDKYDLNQTERLVKTCEIPPDANTVPLCRKTIYILKGKAKKTIKRSCGWVAASRPIVGMKNYDIRQTIFQCFKDLCNHGSHIQIAPIGVISIIIFCLFNM